MKTLFNVLFTALFCLSSHAVKQNSTNDSSFVEQKSYVICQYDPATDGYTKAAESLDGKPHVERKFFEYVPEEKRIGKKITKGNKTKKSNRSVQECSQLVHEMNQVVNNQAPVSITIINNGPVTIINQVVNKPVTPMLPSFQAVTTEIAKEFSYLDKLTLVSAHDYYNPQNHTLYTSILDELTFYRNQNQ